jgi:hypothetical protein
MARSNSWTSNRRTALLYSKRPADDGAAVGVGSGVGDGVALGMGVGEGTGVAVGSGVLVGSGVGTGVTVGGIAVGGITVGAGATVGCAAGSDPEQAVIIRAKIGKAQRIIRECMAGSCNKIASFSV